MDTNMKMWRCEYCGSAQLQREYSLSCTQCGAPIQYEQSNKAAKKRQQELLKFICEIFISR